jgi:hypothetical protein
MSTSKINRKGNKDATRERETKEGRKNKSKKYMPGSPHVVQNVCTEKNIKYIEEESK